MSVVREKEERKTEKTGAARPAFSREGLAALLPSGPILSGVASLPRAAQENSELRSRRWRISWELTAAMLCSFIVQHNPIIPHNPGEEWWLNPLAT